MITRLTFTIWRLWTDRRAQDLVEYALATAFVAVTASAFFPPYLTPSISSIYSKITSIMDSQP